MTDNRALPDSYQVVQTPYAKRELHLLRKYRRYDRRAIPPLWLWSLLKDTTRGENPVPQRDEVDPVEAAYEDTNFSSFTGEAPDIHNLNSRKYGAPVAVHLYVNWEEEKQTRDGGVTHQDGQLTIWMSRSEARRLGRLFGTKDNVDYLVSAPDAVAHYNGKNYPRPGEQAPIYILRPGDVFRFADKYYRVENIDDRMYGPTAIITHYEGNAVPLSPDTVDPLVDLPQPKSFAPTLEDVLWV